MALKLSRFAATDRRFLRAALRPNVRGCQIEPGGTTRSWSAVPDGAAAFDESDVTPGGPSVPSCAMSPRQPDHDQTGGRSGPAAVSRDGRRSADQYDAMAAVYSPANAEGPFNASYERPAMIAMLGDV